MKPETGKAESLLHTCYHGASRIHTAKPYPLVAPNGSSIILLGCENGLRVLWHGGQHAESQSRQRPWKEDGTLLQSASITTKEPAPLSSSYEHAIHEQTKNLSPGLEPELESINLSFGTAVLHIAFAFFPTNSLPHDPYYLPALLSHSIVAAMACSDASVRLVTLPLAPPSVRGRESTEGPRNPAAACDQKNFYGEEIQVILGGSSHQSIPNCISMTLAPSLVSLDSDLEMDDGDAHPGKDILNHCRSTSKSPSRSKSIGRDTGWDLMIASSSSDLSGLLLIHKLPLPSSSRDLHRITTDLNVLLSIQHLPCPAVSLDFTPSLPGDQRNSRLLIADVKGTIRILDCLSTENPNESPCLISLLPSFQSSSHRRQAGRQVLDARWVLGGQAALVLLESGEWGVWDPEGHGPKTQSTFNAHVAPALGSMFTFAALGLLNDESNSFKSDNTDVARRTDGPKPTMLAPTTPSTRRTRQESLFAGSLRHAECPARGGISIAIDQHSKTIDEAVVMWYKHTITIIPSFLTHWADKVKGSGNLFGKGARGEARFLKNGLPGEQRTDVTLLPASDKSSHDGATEYIVLVAGENRYVLVTSPPSSRGTIPRNQLSLRSDQQMLEQGDLDLDSMDKMLSTINEKTGSDRLPGNGINQNIP